MSIVGFNAGRAEHKYLIPEATATALRGFVKAYLAPDQYMPAGEADGYHVHSLYLDSPQYDLYRETKDGVKNRFKLRMRFYDDAPDAPTFLEIKTRTTDAIRKQRAAVSLRSAEAFLNGNRLTVQDLVNPTEASAMALDEFCRRAATLSAQGSAFVSYQREAYVSTDSEGIRITFDRHVVGIPYDSLRGLEMTTERAPVFSGQVVLELKYSGQIPAWTRGLVRDFGLHRISFPKYVHSVDALQLGSLPGEEKMRGIAC